MGEVDSPVATSGKSSVKNIWDGRTGERKGIHSESRDWRVFQVCPAAPEIQLNVYSSCSPVSGGPLHSTTTTFSSYLDDAWRFETVGRAGNSSWTHTGQTKLQPCFICSGTNYPEDISGEDFHDWTIWSCFLFLSLFGWTRLVVKSEHSRLDTTTTPWSYRLRQYLASSISFHHAALSCFMCSCSNRTIYY